MVAWCWYWCLGNWVERLFDDDYQLLLLEKAMAPCLKTLDVILMTATLASIGLWAITGTPTGSVIMLCFIVIIGYIPTFKVVFIDPSHERGFFYALDGLRSFFVVAALEKHIFTTVIFPLTLAVCSSLLSLIIVCTSAQRH